MAGMSSVYLRPENLFLGSSVSYFVLERAQDKFYSYRKRKSPFKLGNTSCDKNKIDLGPLLLQIITWTNKTIFLEAFWVTIDAKVSHSLRDKNKSDGRPTPSPGFYGSQSEARTACYGLASWYRAPRSAVKYYDMNRRQFLILTLNTGDRTALDAAEMCAHSAYTVGNSDRLTTFCTAL